METPRNRDDQLAAELRALRPTPRPEFAAEIDERAAAGFPRRSRRPRPSFDRLRAIPARRLLIPAGGFAVLAIAVVTAVTIPPGSDRQTVQHSAVAQGNAGNRGELLSAEELVREPDAGIERYQGSYEAEAAPMASDAAGSAAAEAEIQPFSANANTSLSHRAVERSATLVLGAAPADVADDSAAIFEVVRAHDGIVMRSSTREGEPGQAGANFELLIPSAKLGDALGELSAIDEVRSRHEATADITAPTVNTTELLRDSKARVDSLLGQLEGAETESEREAVEAELAQERRHRARLRAQLQQLQRRADLSRVLVRIETGTGEESGTGGGNWGIDDALGDAGQILAVAAAVIVVGLAIIGPIALIALLAWLTHRLWVRRERRRVLS